MGVTGNEEAPYLSIPHKRAPAKLGEPCHVAGQLVDLSRAVNTGHRDRHHANRLFADRSRARADSLVKRSPARFVSLQTGTRDHH